MCFADTFSLHYLFHFLLLSFFHSLFLSLSLCLSVSRIILSSFVFRSDTYQLLIQTDVIAGLAVVK